MMKKTLFPFNIPSHFRLVFTALLCLAVLCGCGANESSPVGPPPKAKGDGIPGPTPAPPPGIHEHATGESHFFGLLGLVNFPYESYEYEYGTYSSSLILSDKEQVGELFSETYLREVWSETGELVEDNRFTNLIKSYDEEFFENNELVTFIVSHMGGAYYFELSKVTFDNGILTLEVDYKSYGPGLGGPGVVTDMLGIVEIERIPTDFLTVIQVNYLW